MTTVETARRVNDPEQRQKLLDKLDFYIEELGELIPEKTARGVTPQGVVSSRMRLEVSQRPPPRAWTWA